MNLPVAWLIIGVLEGWAISRVLPGEHPLAPATVWGIVGAFAGGWVGMNYGEPPVLTPSIIGAAVGASVSSLILVVYRLRGRRP